MVFVFRRVERLYQDNESMMQRLVKTGKEYGEIKIIMEEIFKPKKIEGK